MSPAPETLGTPWQRIDRMLELALRICSVDRARLSIIEPDADVLQVRRTAAWLMRQRADVHPADAAAALGVSTEFIQHTVFTARQRIAAQGVRIDGPVEAVAPVIARIFAPHASGPDPIEAASLAEIRNAVLAAFCISEGALVGEGRGARVARARQAFVWLASTLTPAAPKEIGRWINRDRSTVATALSRANVLPGVADLRGLILAALAAGRPTHAALNGFATAIELLGRPSPQPE